MASLGPSVGSRTPFGGGRDSEIFLIDELFFTHTFKNFLKFPILEEKSRNFQN